MTAAARLLDRSRWGELADLLAGWLPAQRWFQGKARDVATVTLADVGILPADMPVLDLVLDVAYEDSHHERYQVPVVEASAPGGIATIDGAALHDALLVPEAARTFAQCALARVSERTAQGATILGEPVTAALPTLPATARPLGVEQSNTSVVFADELLLKVFRKLEPGMNPDVELTRALTERGFSHVPPQVGAIVLDGGNGSVSALAVLTAFRADAREGWELACAEAAAVRDGRSDTRLASEIAVLGSVIAEMHLVLRDAFGQRVAETDDLDRWERGMRGLLDEVLDTARRRAPEVAGRLGAQRDALERAFARLSEVSDGGPLVRTHGDLHLGQVLLDSGHGWQVLDFEGEPARSLADRRQPHSPLRDVAGMLRSFDYAAAHGAPPEQVGTEAAVEAWHRELREAFLSGYAGTAAGTGLLPASDADRVAIRTAFELEKAVYELGYELANRPSWATIPAGGIERLLTEH